MMRQEKFEYMTPQGLLNLQNRLREAELKLIELRSQRRSIVGLGGDGLHDNFAFEQLEIEERGLARAVADLRPCFRANRGHFYSWVRDETRIEAISIHRSGSNSTFPSK